MNSHTSDVAKAELKPWTLVHFHRSLALLYGSVHQNALPERYGSVSGGGEERQSCPKYDFVLLSLVLLAVGLGGSLIIIPAQDIRGDDPWYFTPSIVGCFVCIMVGGGMLLEFLTNRAKLFAQRFRQGAQRFTFA